MTPRNRRLKQFSILLLLLTTFVGSNRFVAAAPQASSLSSEQIREASRQVMQRHDYRSVRRRILENTATPDVETPRVQIGFLQSALESIGDAIGNFFDWIINGIFSSGPPKRVPVNNTPKPASTSSSSGNFEFSLTKVLLFLSLAALLATLTWLLAGVFKASDGRRRIDSDGLFGDEEDLSNLSVPPGELAASTYESRAVQMASDGKYRQAIRELLLGSMSWVERAGMIRFRKGLTNRDYIRAVWRDEDRRFAFGKTALEFERVYFGRRDASQEMFKDCLQAFQGAFREETTTQAV